MKRLINFVVALVMVLMMCVVAMAQSDFIPKGVALVPNIRAHHNSQTNWGITDVNVTNITGQTVQCRVTIYDHEGNDISTSTTLKNGGPSGIVTLGSGDSPFSIPAHGTRCVRLSLGSGRMFGHAVVEWVSDDSKLYKALIAGTAYFRQDSTNLTSSSSSLVNNGQPF